MAQTERKNLDENRFNEDKKQIIMECIKKNDEEIIKKYSKGKFLGKGGFAKVYQVTNLETKQIYAAKVIPKDNLQKNRAKQKLLSEIKLHRSLHHFCIVKFEHVFEDNENVYILLEVCQNQTMNELLRRRKRLCEFEAQSYIAQILHALKYLQKHKIIHRDLKLGNLFLTENMEVKVGDFGLATKLEFEGEKKKTVCGTPNYIAPEILEGTSGHSYEVDIWSLGVILYTLLFGKPPFESDDVQSTYKRIRMNQYSFPDHIQISNGARNLIKSILNIELLIDFIISIYKSPSKRPTIDEIFSSEFFQQGYNIPKNMPISTLACPPTQQYMQSYKCDSINKQFLQPNALSLNSETCRQNSETNQFFVQICIPDSQNQLIQIKPQIKKNQKSQQTFQTQKEQQEQGLNKVACISKNNHVMAKKKIFLTNQTLCQIQIFSLNNESIILNDMAQVTKNCVEIINYLGYILSNGWTGVHFNDQTKMLTDMNSKSLYYFSKKDDEKELLNQIDYETYTFKEYPKELAKKVTLLSHFKNYLTQKCSNIQSIQKDSQQKLSNFVFLKKWAKTNNAILFRLSNKLVQMVFNDQTQILLSSKLKTVNYVNLKKEKIVYPLNDAMNIKDPEMTKRLKYTKNVLVTMIKSETENMPKLLHTNINMEDKLAPTKIHHQQRKSQNFQPSQNLQSQMLLKQNSIDYKSAQNRENQIQEIQCDFGIMPQYQNYFNNKKK